MQQYLSVPVYTIFKNLTIILIAYGEVLWFGGIVTPLTLVSFGLMVSPPFFSFFSLLFCSSRPPFDGSI